MIRVLNVISGLNNAGTEAVVMNYYRHIDRSKVQFDFLVLDERENLYYEKEIEELGGRVFKIVNFRKNPLKNIIQRKSFFKKHANDFKVAEIHSPTAYRAPYCKLAKKFGIEKVVFHIHNTSSECGLLINNARRIIDKYCDKTVTCSQYAARSVLGKNADGVVLNAIEYDKYKFNSQIRSEVRAFYNIKENERVIGHIGRFSEQKNHTFLLEVFSQLVANDKSYKLILKGFGELKFKILKKVEELSIQDNVIIDDKYEAYQLYSSFDLFVLPSLYEGLAVVAIEAQANSLKCIFSDRVSEEFDISGKNRFVELNVKKWIDAVRETNFERISSNFKFSLTGYDINEAAQNLQNYYLGSNE